MQAHVMATGDAHTQLQALEPVQAPHAFANCAPAPSLKQNGDPLVAELRTCMGK